MPAPRVRVIVNPRAGGGRAERCIPAMARSLDRHGLAHEIVRTTAPGDAGRLARAAIDDGVDVIAVAGGDGSINEVAQGFIGADGRARSGPLPDFALIPAGTGGDFRKTVGLPNDIDGAIARIRAGATRPLDLGLLELTGHAGEPVTRAFVNIASFGVSGVADRLVNDAPKWIGGRVAYFLGSARAVLSYRNAPVRVRVDGAPLYEGRTFLVAIANGRYFGAGMKIAPTADPSDGRFEVIALGDLSLAEALGLSRTVYRGAHVSMPGTRIASGTIVEAEPLDPAQPVWLDVDGETPGKLPLRATIAPSALRLRV